MMVRPMRDERDAPATDGIASAAEAYGFVGWVVSTAFYGAALVGAGWGSSSGFRVQSMRWCISGFCWVNDDRGWSRKSRRRRVVVVQVTGLTDVRDGQLQ
jgi:hypothetical protein